MKKLYLLLAISVLLCGTMSAQYAKHDFSSNKANLTTSKINTNKQKPNTQKDGDAVWSCDFENSSAYTIVDGTGTVSTWHATSEADYPASLVAGQGFYFWPMNFSGNSSQQAYQGSETPSTWMILNLIGEHYCNGADCWGDGIWGPIETSIVFSDIDLSACAAPKFSLNQSYRAFNPAWNMMYVETSLDGGATWTEHQINVGTWQNGTYIDDPIEVLIPEVGNHSGVAVRIRYINDDLNGDEQYAAQYGWQIDDAKIVEAAAHNLTINNARISMFSFFDYKQDLTEYWTNSNMTAAEKRDYAYQLYDPYAQTPAANWDGAYAAFSVELTNNGATNATPKVNVVVTGPNGDEVYNQTLTGRSIATTVGDTIDFATIDDENMANTTVFYFEGAATPGRYTATFTVSEEGVEDSNPDDNTLTQYFDITENAFSKAFYEPNTSFSANGYTISSSGDRYGASFLYLAAPDDIMSADLFIADRTTAGTSVKVVVYHQNDDGDYVQQRESEWAEITEDMIGTWTNFTFTNPYTLAFEEGETYREVTVMAEIDYEGDQTIYFGSSDILATRGHSSMEYLAQRDKWYYGADDIALTFHTGEGVQVEAAQNVVEGVEMYPNPSNGIVNFTNVENATIEVYNMMGQVVASVNNADANASIDLSNVANGNYVVRIVKDGAIATSKLNIVK